MNDMTEHDDINVADSIPRRLTRQAQLDRDEFKSAGFPNCSCHISPPCSSCTHPGNPLSQEDDEFFEPDDEEMPPADPALLASANRMLAERLACVAHALRGSGLASLRDISDCENLQQHVAALTGAYQMAIADRDKAQALVDILKRNFESKEHECEALRKHAEAANERAAGANAAGEIVGYYVVTDPMPEAVTLDDAINLAMCYVRDCGESHQVLEVRRIGTAKRVAEWVPV